MGILRKNSGYSLMELVVVAGVMTVVTLGVSTVMTNMYSQYRKIQLDQTLENLRIQFVAAINGTNRTTSLDNVTMAGEGVTIPDSWQATLTDAANAGILGCIRNQTLCADGTAGNLRVSDGQAIIYDPGVANMGFRVTGESCNQFPDPNCLIRYNITATLRCDEVGGNCLSPSIGVTLALDFDPGPNSGYSADDIQKLENRWNFVIRKGGKGQTWPVTIAERSTGVPQPGSCAALNTWCSRNINTVLEDASGAVATGAAPLWNFTLQPGFYSCHIIMPAWSTDGFRVRLLDVGAGAVVTGSSGTAAEASGRAPRWTYSGGTIELSTDFAVTNASAYRVQMTQEAYPIQVGNRDWSFGMLGPGAPPYAAANLTVVRCLRTIQ